MLAIISSLLEANGVVAHRLGSEVIAEAMLSEPRALLALDKRLPRSRPAVTFVHLHDVSDSFRSRPRVQAKSPLSMSARHQIRVKDAADSGARTAVMLLAVGSSCRRQVSRA